MTGASAMGTATKEDVVAAETMDNTTRDAIAAARGTMMITGLATANPTNKGAAEGTSATMISGSVWAACKTD
ncbi:hypothetical protein [Bhargavaea massiliensis]|uniref:hypothetical protein n=1 Tax=Bhargavaea massiliensis TaxID=2697500 RepID=UPI001BD04CE0|nr:hypothetical protein [Bhargavaea massiliensis]